MQVDFNFMHESRSEIVRQGVRRVENLRSGEREIAIWDWTYFALTAIGLAMCRNQNFAAPILSFAVGAEQ